MKAHETDTVFLEATQTDFLLGNRFLKQHKQSTAGRQDRLFLVKHQQAVVAAAWLRPLQASLAEPFADVYWLRSLFVAPEYRHQSLASRLLSQMHTSVSKTPIICLAKPTLSTLYLKNGFQIQAFDDLPLALQQRFSPYCQQHPAWQIFTRL